MTLFGTARSPGSILEELRPEFPLLRTSGGGVTFSGGEPTLHPEFATELAKALRREGITAALETCGCFDLERQRPLIRELAYILFDLKLFREEDHRRFCGAGNDVITANLKSLAACCRENGHPLLWPRLPLVPGITDGQDNIRSWAKLLHGLGIPYVTIVPYHPMGESKRRWLGLPEGPALRVPGEEEIRAAEMLFKAEGIQAFRPGEEDWDIRNASGARLTA
jgi:pyruvate formate lyase activating enzyme